MAELKKHFQEESSFGMDKTFWTKEKESLLKEALLAILLEGILLGLQPTIPIISKLTDPNDQQLQMLQVLNKIVKR